MDVLSLVIYMIWLLSEIMVNRLTRSTKQDQPGKDKNSLSLIWATIIVSISLAVYVALNYLCPIYAGLPIVYAGLSLILTGVIFRLIIVRSLGNYFTADVTIRENHTLKKDGFYKHLRHPSYFASLVSFIGFGITLNNWISLAIIVTAILSAFIYRIKVEEKALLEYFGQEYAGYKKSTKAIIPFIY